MRRAAAALTAVLLVSGIAPPAEAASRSAVPSARQTAPSTLDDFVVRSLPPWLCRVAPASCDRV